MSKHTQSVSTVLRIHLAPPLPERRFLFVCKSPDVRHMKDELCSRLKKIATEPIVVLKDGYELMDQDEVSDLLTHMDLVSVHLASNCEAGVYTDTQPQGTLALASSSEASMDEQAKHAGISACSSVNPGPRQVTISSVEHGDPAIAKRRKPNPFKSMFPVEQSYAVLGQRPASEEAESSSDSSSDADPPTPQPLVRAGEIASYTTAQLEALAETPTSKVNVGDTVAFMVAELSADMAPVISDYRIGQVTGKAYGTISISTLRDFADRSMGSKRSGTKRRRNQLLVNAESSGELDESTKYDISAIASLKVLSAHT
ncbi:hypothetical protein DL89DRAFT_283197 [Linderina pennispora]|uniref:Coilin tudor domain-containing protein n=1 Tax=Linderina pennispora TaxID=61395 RepID=A0A1Y1WAN7_9FUNG|nr:uncharacterized protein DL89DRAFT_283197 [Linderina pennispora]ORX70620.1 hypothetical protein DL89DRAFT_283197 [Linderina pennispora]